MKVFLSNFFFKNFCNFPKVDKEKIIKFIIHVENYGLTNLEGKLKRSDEIPNNHPNWLEIITFVQEYNLWHYHIGIPEYIYSDKGNTSKYLLHFLRGENYIKIVDMNDHPPFALPDINSLHNQNLNKKPSSLLVPYIENLFMFFDCKSVCHPCHIIRHR